MTTLTRTAVHPLLLTAALVVAGCGSYDDPSRTTQVSAASETTDAQRSADAPAVAVAPPAAAKSAPSLSETRPPAAAMIAATEQQANRAISAAQLKPRALADTDVKPTTRPAVPTAASTLSVVPKRLVMGTVSTGKYATGTVTLTNTGSEPITISQCKTSCGCTSANCPKGESIEPGGSREVEIRITAGSRARQINKTVTFIVEAQKPVTLPVSVEVIAYVTITPQTIDPDVNADGKLVLKATDDVPFRIISITPAVVEALSDAEAVEHELYISWDKWRELGQNRRLVVNIDHPEVEQVSALVRTRPQQANAAVRPNQLQQKRDALLRDGVVNPPLTEPGPAQKLAVAVKYGDVKQISEAIGTGLGQSERDELLGLASRYGQIEVMSLLLENGANAETKDKFGRTAMLAAVQSRNTEAVTSLLARGADANARDLQLGTPLQRAAGFFGNEQMVLALVKAGADVNASDKNGQTPLMWAARWGDAGRVQVLVNAGANANVRDDKGMTALDYARNRKGEGTKALIAIIEPLAAGDGTSGDSDKPSVD